MTVTILYPVTWSVSVIEPLHYIFEFLSQENPFIGVKITKSLAGLFLDQLHSGGWSYSALRRVNAGGIIMLEVYY